MATDTAKPNDPSLGIRFFLAFEAFMRLFMWQIALYVTIRLFTSRGYWPEGSPFTGSTDVMWAWAERIAWAVFVFNVVFLLELLILRLVIPTPKEGEYDTTQRKIPASLIWYSLISIITRARFDPPAPAFLVFHLSNLPGVSWFVSRIMGPKSKSCLVLNPMIPDPDLTEFGRNVIVGNMTSIIAHTQIHGHVAIKKTIVEDDVMIGAHSLIYSGCHIRKGAIVYGGSIVRPNTVIGEYEAWAGVPARKIKDLRPYTAAKNEDEGTPAAIQAEAEEAAAGGDKEDNA